MMRTTKLVTVILFITYELAEAQKQFEVNVDDYERLALEVNRLRDLAEKKNGVIQDIERKFEHQETVNRELEDRLNQQDAVITDLKETTAKQEQYIKDMTSKQTLPEIVAVEPEAAEISTKSLAMESLNGNAAKRQATKRQTPDYVAFFAVISQRNEDNLAINQNIIFEDVLTNIGNGYKNYSGIFIAPVGGIYLITTSVLSRQDQEYWAEVMVNGTPVARLNGHGTVGRHGTGAQTAILFLRKGDDVAVQNYHAVDSFWGDKYSSFGGVLIQEYEEGLPSVIG